MTRAGGLDDRTCSEHCTSSEQHQIFQRDSFRGINTQAAGQEGVFSFWEVIFPFLFDFFIFIATDFKAKRLCIGCYNKNEVVTLGLLG